MKQITITFVLFISLTWFGNVVGFPQRIYPDTSGFSPEIDWNDWFKNKKIRGFDEKLIDEKTPIGKCRLDCGYGFFTNSVECHEKCANLYGETCTELDLHTIRICINKCGWRRDVETGRCHALCRAQCRIYA